jgi:hypothetical protein
MAMFTLSLGFTVASYAKNSPANKEVIGMKIVVSQGNVGTVGRSLDFQM